MNAIFLTQLIPAEYRPLLACISTNAFKVIEWKELLLDLPQLFTQNDDSANSKKGIRHENLGDTVLEIYFTQIFAKNKTFLDLRKKHFVIDSSGLFVWKPNGFQIQWKEDFRLGLIKIYSGYYENQPDLLREGLFQIGLAQHNMSPEKITEIESMLLSHIGGSLNEKKFVISDFTQSFEKFFDFLIKNNIRLKSDFFYLGIYLASLYHCLQELGGTYDVQKAYLTAKKNLNEK